MENKAKKTLKGFYFFMTTIQKYYKYLNLSTAFAKNYHSHYTMFFRKKLEPDL